MFYGHLNQNELHHHQQVQEMGSRSMSQCIDNGLDKIYAGEVQNSIKFFNVAEWHQHHTHCALH